MISPDEFAERCRAIVAESSGHDAHRKLDELTNEVMSDLGYAEGIEIFKTGVAATHTGDGSYAYWARGERNGLAKLNPALVREIRSSPERNVDIGRRLNVSDTTIGHIRLRKTWKHIP